MARLPFGRNPFAEAEPTPSMIANQSRPAPSTIQNLSRPPPPPPRDMAEKNDRNRKRDFGDNSKANPGKKLKNAMIDNSSTDLVVSTFGSLAAENFSEDEVKLLNNRSDEEAELSFRSGLGDAFYHGLRVLAQKNSIIKDQERSLKKLKGEASSHATKMAEAQKKLDGEIRARKDDVDKLQLTLDKANFDLDNLKRTHEDEIAKLRSENELLLASTRKGQSEAYNAGFLDYLRNFLAADPDYNWAQHFAPSTPGYMITFKADNAELIEAAKDDLRKKIASELKAAEDEEARKNEVARNKNATEVSPTHTTGN